MQEFTDKPMLIKADFVDIVDQLLPNLNQPTNDFEALSNYQQILDSIQNFQANQEVNEE